MTDDRNNQSDGRDWLGYPWPFPQPIARVGVPMGPSGESIGGYLTPTGDALEAEQTDLRIWRDVENLHVEVRCETVDMERVRKLALRETPYGRDEWGDDAIELQIDVGRTKQEYWHLILPPNGMAVPYVGYSNRQIQGWDPKIDYTVELLDDCWTLSLILPFALLGKVPVEGEVWGFNTMRVNATEPTGYVQWAPTFDEALNPDLFGELIFGDFQGNRTSDIADYGEREVARKMFFFETINDVDEDAALAELGVPDWQAWSVSLSERSGPEPLRWDGVRPGKDGISEESRPLVMERADALVEEIKGWSDELELATGVGVEPLEVLGDAYLLTGDHVYAEAFEKGIAVHHRCMKLVLGEIIDTRGTGRHYSVNPYHDSQVVRAEMLAYTYINMRDAGLSLATHRTMMWIVLRSARFAAFNISNAYVYGNHQLYESGGMAALVALFPEFREAQSWADVASRSIRLHLERELYPDGGYLERCGYHCVALTFAMHGIATVHANKLEDRFPEMMSEASLGALKKMHHWMLMMTAPDGTMPAFGDAGASCAMRYHERGVAILSMAELAWPLSQLVPDLVPAGTTPLEPSEKSVSLPSGFTVMRDGWSTDALYMAVDHGPLGGQHSHLDTMGFCAFAFGQPIALDAGIGKSYSDPLYMTWFRDLRAHNVVLIGDLEPKKVAERTSWVPGDARDVLTMRSFAYQAALGVTHDRRITFVKGVGWLIEDTIEAPETNVLDFLDVDCMLHAPQDLSEETVGVLHGVYEEVGLIVLLYQDGEESEVTLEKTPSSLPLPKTRGMRPWDGSRQHGSEMVRDVTSLTWRKENVTGHQRSFAMFLLPYQGDRPKARLEKGPEGWTLVRGDQSIALA